MWVMYILLVSNLGPTYHQNKDQSGIPMMGRDKKSFPYIKAFYMSNNEKCFFLLSFFYKVASFLILTRFKMTIKLYVPPSA